MIVSTLEAVLRADISDFTAGLSQAEQMLADVAGRMSARLDGIGASMPGAPGLAPPSLEIASTPGMGDLSASVRDALAGALGAATGGDQPPFPALIAVAPELAVDVKALTDQMQRFVDVGAAARIFKATLLADVTVLANRINLDRLIGSVSAAVNGIKSGVGNSAKAADGIPRFAAGGVMAHEGLAYLHPGERVLTAAQTRAYDRGHAGRAVVVNAYGESPYELARMIARVQAETGV